MSWIRIQDALPKQHGLVIVYAPGNPLSDDVAPYLYNTDQPEFPLGFAATLPPNVVSKITHWQPLPDRPGGDDLENLIIQTVITEIRNHSIRNHGILRDQIRAIAEEVCE